MPPRPFDVMIGQLDRLLSEFLLAAKSDLDEADRQTIKHHADDLIGVGNRAHEVLREVFLETVLLETRKETKP